MRNFIRFLTKNAFIFLFLFLELISFIFLMKNNNYQSSKFLNSSNFLVGNLFETISNVTDYLNLKTENEILRVQNAKLLSANKNSFTKVFGTTVQINDTSYFQKYIYSAAKVINNSTNQRENYITIDKGAINGIKQGMAVINSDGVVGIVKNVSTNFSSVISLLHQKNSISGKFKDSNYYGSVVWDSDKNQYNTALLKEIPNHVKLNIGDSIITSGFSSIFPEGILIGTIKSYDLPKGNNFYDIEINLSVDFKKLSHVYIVKSLLKEEQTQLEKLNQ
ncbi:MAG: rod shape-determining protein MreC [Bacteroidetes bacterium HGW-Bacteroidetes-12]|nr:MAG: rod shape-determining protein MreC [Bacteroidetes bacterium HGW-Bacteroidetes-12]